MKNSSISALLASALLGFVLVATTPASADCGKDGCPFKNDKSECAGGCPFGKSPEAMQKRLDQMKERLGLSDAQTAKVKQAFEEARTQHAALREQPKGSEKFKAMRKVKWDTQDKVSAALTCEQRETLRKMKREQRAKRFARRHKRKHSKNKH